MDLVWPTLKLVGISFRNLVHEMQRFSEGY